MRILRAAFLTSLGLPCFGSLVLKSPSVDTSQFVVTQFVTGLSTPLSTLALSDGSVAITTSAGIFRYTDTDHDGIADGPGVPLFTTDTGPHTGLIRAGSDYIDGNTGDHMITILQPGATPASPLTSLGALQLTFPDDWEHNQIGIAARPTPNQAGFYDLVFNIGSRFDHDLSTGKVTLGGGLASGTLDGDSLYVITLDLNGPLPVASNLHKVASGIRNVIGMGFSATGDFYFADNAIDGTGPGGDEPPQAEELNRIAAADLAGSAQNFGYPDCYIQYRSGTQIGSGCVLPLLTFQPIPNGTALGSESEGVTQLAFAPANFPNGFNNGIFLGFAGKFFLTGTDNEENAVVYYDFATGNYLHFSENSQDGVYMPIGVMTTADSLFISDYGSGIVYEVRAAVPEPQSLGLITLGLAALACGARRPGVFRK